MAQGKLIAEHPELEKFVIEMLKKGCAYKHIIKKAKDRFNINISYALITQYKKNYLPVEIILPKQKRKRRKPSDDIEKGIIPVSEMDYADEIEMMEKRMQEIDERHGGEVLIKGDRVLNWYASRIARLEEQVDKLLKLKRRMNEDEMKNFIRLINLQTKLYQQVVKLFSEDMRKNEMKNLGADILERVMKVFNRTTPQEEKLRHQDFRKRLEEEMNIIHMKYFGERM
ncbi:hypothetical protein ES703_19145 [subsurface metagenome]